VDAGAGLIIGLIAGVACFWAVTSLKRWGNYDDSLDVFGVHGIGGILGMLLTGVFAAKEVGGTAGLLEGNPNQFLLQSAAVLITMAWCGAVSFAILKAIDLAHGLRVGKEEEIEGLDISQHGEAVP